MTSPPATGSAAAIYGNLHRYSIPPTVDSIQCIVPQNVATLSVDHLILLHAVDTFPNGGLYCGPWLQEAARRYSTFWLPLLARTPQYIRQFFVPPLDIAYVWYLHRLKPQSYQNYCIGRFGSTIQPSSLQAFNFETNPTSATPWTQLCGKEPFYPPKPRHPVDAQAAVAALLESGFDVETAANTQSSYLRHYLRACYLDPSFLKQAYIRYCKYLVLCCTFSGLPLAPYSDIDLMWRTHVCILEEIQVPCSQVLRQVITYDHGLHTVTEQQTLRSALKRTRAMWAVQFPGERLAILGSDFVPATARIPVEAKVQAEVTYYMGESLEPGKQCDGPRAGAHALYLQWMATAAQRHEDDKETKKQGVLKSLFREKRNIIERRARAQQRHKVAAAEFHIFRNLPHSRTHEYWKELEQYHAGGPVLKVAVGAAVGTPRFGAPARNPFTGRYFVTSEGGESMVGRMRLDWARGEGFESESDSDDDADDVLVMDSGMSWTAQFQTTAEVAV